VKARVDTPQIQQRKEKMKKIIISSKDISAKQWSNLVLELNIIKKQWKQYATLDISGRGLEKILAFGTKTYDPSEEKSD